MSEHEPPGIRIVLPSAEQWVAAREHRLVGNPAFINSWSSDLGRLLADNFTGELIANDLTSLGHARFFLDAAEAVLRRDQDAIVRESYQEAVGLIRQARPDLDNRALLEILQTAREAVEHLLSGGSYNALKEPQKLVLVGVIVDLYRYSKTKMSSIAYGDLLPDGDLD